MMRVSSFTSSSKTIMKRILKILFVLIAIGAICTTYMRYTAIYKGESFYDYKHFVKPDTIDVLTVGSSHAYCGVNPIQMYDDYGISAYNLASGNQSIWFSYYYIKEVLKDQRPKVILLDIYTIANLDDSFDYNIPMNFLSMPFGYYKYEALKNAGAGENLEDILFEFPTTHTRYNELDRSSFQLNDSCTLGYQYFDQVFSFENVLDYATITEQKPISEKAEQYLRKVLELCNRRGIQLVLFNAPCPTVTEEQQQGYNYVAAIAEEYGVPFINGCVLASDIGIDYQTDCFDEAGHLNYSGVTKFTKWVEEYLLTLEELRDHRGEENYSHWEEASERLAGRIYNDNLDADNVVDYLNLIVEDPNRYTVVLYNGYENKLEPLGILLDQPQVLVIQNGEVVFQASGAMGYEYYDWIDQYSFFYYGNSEYQEFKLGTETIYRLENTDDVQFNVYTYNTEIGVGSWKKKEFINP